MSQIILKPYPRKAVGTKIKRLFRFLKDRNAYVNYLTAFQAQGIDTERLLSRLNKYTPYEIATAFNWDLTNEGFHYWNNLDVLWRKKLSRHPL